MNQVVLRTFRYDPAGNGRERFDEFRLEAFPTMTVLDALFTVAREQDSSISFRCACRVGMCGSCGMVINGREGLACQTKVRDVGPKITLRPLHNLPVVKDLVVDMRPFLERYRAVVPNSDTGLSDIARVLPGEGGWLEEEGNCILCGACLSACTMVALSEEFLGPAALYRAALLFSDPREPDKPRRLALVDSEQGIWRCHGHMDCTKVCPVELPLTQAIHYLKRAAVRNPFAMVAAGPAAEGKTFGRRGPASGEGAADGGTSL